jgi:tRNA 2-thiouridine synthesizing protein A
VNSPAPVVIDGGARACVQLLLELRDRLTTLPAGTVVHLLATDPAAPLDLAAWCHLTGHTYVGALPPDRYPRPGYALRVTATARRTDTANPWRPGGR